MQILNYYTGVISRQAIMLMPSIEQWASEWLSKADQAERKGSQLFVVEIPKDAQVLMSGGEDADMGVTGELQLIDADLMRELLT